MAYMYISFTDCCVNERCGADMKIINIAKPIIPLQIVELSDIETEAEI